MQALQETEEKLFAINKYMEENKLRFQTLQNQESSYKVKILENLPELEKTVKNNSEDIFTQKIGITNCEKNLDSATKKYDKIVIENLNVPGLIGNSCQYKNLREYIEVNKTLY